MTDGGGGAVRPLSLHAIVTTSINFHRLWMTRMRTNFDTAMEGAAPSALEGGAPDPPASAARATSATRRFSTTPVALALLIGALAAWVRPSASIGDAAAASPPLAPHAVEAAPPAKAPIGLSGGAPSIDALLDQFLAAVEQKDKDALHRLRVTKAEFQEIIVPGMVAKGQPPRQVSEQPQEFFWSLNDAKSRYFAQELFERFGGRHYIERQLSFTKGTREYAWYTAHGQVQLALRPADDPHIVKLRTGTIAEVDGRFKFISFQWEN